MVVLPCYFCANMYMQLCTNLCTLCQCKGLVQMLSTWPCHQCYMDIVECLRVVDVNIQEGWLSPTERASVSAISLRHIIWLLTRVTPVCRCECKHLATSRESKAHFGFPGYAPGTIAIKFYMDGKSIQSLSNASQHVSLSIYLQPFPSN